MIAGASMPAPPLRAVTTSLGIALLLLALRLVRRRAPETGASHQVHRAAVGWAVLRLSGLACHVPGLTRRGDAETLPVRIAAAPRAWPARAVAAGLQAHAHRAATHPDRPATPLELPALAASLRLLTALALAVPAAAAALLLVGTGGAALVGALSGLAASRLPDLALAAAARSAARAAAADTAAVLDMLAATAAAGLSLPEAMVLTAGHAPPPIAAALRAAAVRRAMGEEPQLALTAEAHRHGVSALAEAGQAIDRQRRLGAALAPELTRIAAQLRTDQRAAALRRAARRGPLGTLIVALVIAPLCVAMVVACVVGGLVQSGPLTPQ